MRSTELAALLLLFPRAAQDTHRFRVEVSRVHVDVFITREGRSVRSLTAEDFEVLDEGLKQAVDVADAELVPRTFVILLDESGSVSGRSQELLRDAVAAFAGGLKPEDELAVLSFAERTTLRKPLGFEGALEQPGVFEIEGSGWTALNDAVFVAMAYLRNAKGRPILVIFTDGVDNASWIDEPAVLESARFSEVVVYNVMVEAAANTAPGAAILQTGGISGRSVAMLRELSTLTGGRTLQAERPEELSRALQAILSEVSARHLLSFSPSASAKPGWHELRVKVKGVRDADVRARAGYFLSAQ